MLKSPFESFLKHISPQRTVYTVAFNPQGNVLATGGHDIVLWDVYTGKEIMRLEDEERVAPIHAVVFSPNGKILVSSGGRAVCLWNVETGKPLKHFANEEATIKTIALSPNGEILASGTGTEDRILMRNIFNGQILRQLDTHQGAVNAIAFSPLGEILASSDDAAVYLWNVQTGEELKRFEHTQKKFNKVHAIAFSAGGNFLASGTWDGNVHVWDVLSGQELFCLAGNSGSVQAVAFNPKGHFLATGSSDNKVHFWNMHTGKELICLTGHTGSINAVAFSPNGILLASASEDKTVQLWDVQSGKILRRFEGHTSQVNSVTYNPNGQFLVSVHSDQKMHLWQTESGKQRFCLETDEILAMAFHPDGDTLTSISSTTMSRWELKTGKAIQQLKLKLAKFAKPLAIAISPDNQTLAASFTNNLIQLWNLQTGQALNQLQLDEELAPIHLLSFSPNSQILAAASVQIFLWKFESDDEFSVPQLEGRSDGVNQGEDLINTLAFSPAGNLIASGIGHHNVYVWNIENGKEVKHLYGEFQGHSAPINTVAFSPDGHLLAAGSDYNVIFLWKIETGEQLAMLEGHTYGISAVAFSPDGNHLASGSWDHTVRWWDLTTYQEQRLLIGGARGTWLSCSAQGCSRFDDGTLLTKTNQANRIQAVLPAKGKAGHLKVLEVPPQLSLAIGELCPFTLTIGNIGRESLCWVQVVQIPNPDTALVLHTPKTLVFLATRKTKQLKLQVSAGAAYQHPQGEETLLTFKITSAFAKPLVIKIPVTILSPNLNLSQVVLLKQHKPLLFMIIRNHVSPSLFRFKLPIPHFRLPKIIVKKQNKYLLMTIVSNHGTTTLTQTQFSVHIKNKNKLLELDSVIRESIKIGQSLKIIFPVPNQIKINKQCRLSLLASQTGYPPYEWEFPDHVIELPLPAWHQWRSRMIELLKFKFKK